MILLLLACASGVDGFGAAGLDGPDSDAQVGDVPGMSTPPLARVDVLVIGGGSSGLAAALSAHEAGASVLVVERSAELGGSSSGAGQQFGAGTRWQAERGVDDSAELALAEWAALTGGRGDDPNVAAFVRGSADTLAWLEELGAEISLSPATEPGASATPRIHNVFWEPGTLPVEQASAALGDQVWTSTSALALLRDTGGSVVGAELERPGGSGWVQAASVIVASGGFARNDALMVEARPELAARSFLYEAGPSAVGAGAGLVPGAGGAAQNLEHYGLYLHAAPDPRFDGAREALQLTAIESALVVTPAGVRLRDESALTGFEPADVLLDAGYDHAYALVPASVYPAVEAQVPGYNWTDTTEPQRLDATQLLELGVAVTHADVASVAAATGMPLAALQDTLDRYEAQVAAGVDDEFAKDERFLVPFAGGPLVVVELRPGAAKAFGGARTDAQMRALDADGAVIPGLYVVGEAAGFLGTDAIGLGFSGSVTACAWGGRVAGLAAAADD